MTSKHALNPHFNTFSDGVVIPHGIYDREQNEGYITLGTSKDMSEFCFDCIKYWWENYGKKDYHRASSILVLSDGDGSNSSRHYIFKEDLQKLVNEIGIETRMVHYPPLYFEIQSNRTQVILSCYKCLQRYCFQQY